MLQVKENQNLVNMVSAGNLEIALSKPEAKAYPVPKIKTSEDFKLLRSLGG